MNKVEGERITIDSLGTAQWNSSSFNSVRQALNFNGHFILYEQLANYYYSILYQLRPRNKYAVWHTFPLHLNSLEKAAYNFV